MPELRPIPFGDLAREAAFLAKDLESVARETLASGWFILGKRLEAFERDFARYLAESGGGEVEVVGCASGTEAIALALMAHGIGPGKLVATVANTCAPTATGIRMTGADLLLLDADPKHLLLDPEVLAHALDAHPIDAVVPVHLYGNAAPMDRILDLCRGRGIAIIEDAAQGHGAAIGARPVGTLADAAAFSFYPTKNLGACGDAGAVTTRDAEQANRLRALRNYGYPPGTRDHAAREGLNSRLDEMQAAILSVKLRHLEVWNERRRVLAARYDEALRDQPDIRPVSPGAGTRSARHLYAVQCVQRDALKLHLAAAGIQTQIHYPHPLHQMPAFRAHTRNAAESFPVAERAAAELLSLPMYPFLRDDEVDRVVDALARWKAD